MNAPRIPVTALFVGFNTAGAPIDVSRNKGDITNSPKNYSTVYVTNALSEPCPGHETPTGGEIISLLVQVQKRLREQQLVATQDDETKDLVHLEVECEKMLLSLGHDPITKDALDAGENLARTLEQYVGSTALDEINLAIEGLVHASIKAAVHGSSGLVISDLAAAGVLNVPQPPGVNLASVIHKILIEKVH